MPYTYIWSSAQTTQAISSLAPGSYIVTATDGGGCTATATYSITQPAALVISNPVIANASCTGGGSITITTLGGTGLLTATWSNTQTGNSISNLASGSYTVTVQDANACSATATYTVGAAPNGIVFGAPAVTNVNCNAGANGSITVNASSASGGITYLWNTTATGVTINGLVAGTYSVSATDLGGCTASATQAITQPTAVVLNAPTISNSTCTAGGSIAVSATGGTGTILFAWSNTQTGAAISNISAGLYTATASDQNGCSATATYNVAADPNAVIISNPIISNATCFAAINGGIAISTSGGTGALTANWSNAQSGNSITGLAAGSYTVTVSDPVGCSAQATYSITQPTVLNIDSARVLNAGCFSVASGSIRPFVSGGTMAYAYSWVRQSNTQTYTTDSIQNLAADTYTLTVTDNNGCTTNASYIITEPVAITFTQAFTNVTCNGGNNGTATINILTGTAPYLYNWNGLGNQANNVLPSVAAGLVNVTFTDANCSASATFTITEPTAVVLALINQTNVSCNGGNNGAVTVNATGGTGTLNYIWSNGQTTATASGLSIGLISVTTTDANACSATLSFNITEPSALITTATVTDATCNLAANGSISVSVTGGVSAYTYLWSDGQTTANAVGLVAGTYACTVTDANGCTAIVIDVVNEPASIVATYIATSVKCIGDANGTITLSPSGGTPSYTISTNQNFADANGLIQGLQAQTYPILITDMAGCSTTISAQVPDASPNVFTVSTDSTSCFGADYNDGIAYILATSIENGPYQFSIDGGAYQYSGDFFNLSAGQHVIYTINNNGCTNAVPVTVEEPLAIEVQINPDTVLLPLGEGQQVQVNYSNAANVTYSWTPQEGLSCADCPNPYVSAYVLSDYVVTVSMQKGSAVCYGTAALHVNVEPYKPLFIPNSFSPNGDGNNDMFLVFGEDIKLVDLKIFNRWGELVFQTTNQFAGWDGTYKGQLQNPQVFTYVSKITFLNDKQVEHNGSITILR